MQPQKSTRKEWFSSPYLSRIFLGIGLTIAFFVLASKCFAHVHIEFEPPPGTWESFERQDQKEAYEKSQTQEGRDSMSGKEKCDALVYELENTA